MPSSHTKSLIAIIGMVSVVGIVFGLTGPLLNLLLERQDISSRAIGFNGSMMAVGTLVLTPLVPRITARVGAMGFLYLCLGLIIGLFSLMKLWPSYAVWLVLRFLLGGATAGLFVVSETWINHLATPANRGRILGVYTAVLSAGFGLGPVMIEFTGLDGWPPFIAGAGFIVLAALALASVHTKPPAFEENADHGLLYFLRASPIAIVAGLLYGAIESGIFGLLPVFGVRTGLTEEAAARLLTAVALGNIIFQVPIGWLADRLDTRLVLAGCAGFGVLGGFGLALLSGTAAIWPVLVIWGGTITGLYTVGLTILGRQYTGMALAGANAALISAYGLGSLAGPTALGAAMDIHDPNGLSYGLAAIALMFVVMLFVWWRRAPAADPQVALD